MVGAILNPAVIVMYVRRTFRASSIWRTAVNDGKPPDMQAVPEERATVRTGDIQLEG